MEKKFVIEKEIEYKNGKVDTWYFIKLMTGDDVQVIDLCKDDEEKANQLFDNAVESWIPKSKAIIREQVVESNNE